MRIALARIRSKLERADYHFKIFEAALGLGAIPVNPASALGFEAESERQGLWIQIELPEPSVQRGIAIGDVLHQLRSSLDHLAYALSTRTRAIGDKEAKKLSFPIYKDATDFHADWRVSQGFFERMLGNEEFAEVKLSQPYERNPDNPPNDPLWILSQLNNIDKHRTVLVLDDRIGVSGSATSDEGHRADFWLSKKPVKPEAEVFYFRWAHPVPPTAVDVHDVSRFIVFETGGVCDHRQVLPGVRSIFSAVTHTIDRFERFF